MPGIKLFQGKIKGRKLVGEDRYSRGIFFLKRPASVSAYLLHDTFTDTNGTALDAHTMDVGDGWTQQSGSTTIQSNRFQGATSGSHNYATADAGQSDVTAQADFVFSGASQQDVRLLLRFQDTSNFWFVLCELSGGVQQVNLYQKLTGSDTLRGSADTTLASGTRTIRADCSGSSITVYLDGAELFSYGSATELQDKTLFGMSGYFDGSYAVVPSDNFEVSAL